MIVQNRAARPARTRRRNGPAAPSQKRLASSTMILTGPGDAGVRRRSTSWRSSTARTTTSATACAISIAPKMENFSRPLIVALLRAQHGARRLAPVARRRRARFSRSARPARAVRRSSARSARSSAVVIAGGFIVIALWVFFVEGAVMTLDSQNSRRADRRQVGSPQVREQAGQPGQPAQIQVIIVGTGLAGASAAASLGELGYRVKLFCIHDSPRRAHSIAAQGGINAAKNYRTTATASTGCSTTRSRAATIARAKRTSTGWRS